MYQAVIILSIVLYIVFGITVGLKQYEAIDKDQAPAPGAIFSAIFWPIVLFAYFLNTAFFKPWKW